MAKLELQRMPGRFGRYVRSLAEGAGAATARFPVASLLIVAIAILSNLAIRDVFIPDQANYLWLLAALYGATASSVAASLFLEGRDAGRLLRNFISLLAGAAVGSLIWWGSSLSVYSPALIAAATFAVPLAPFIGRGTDDRFWAFTLWTFVGVTLAFLSVLLFVLGVSAILEMIRYLFDTGLSSSAYEHIYTTALTLVGPLFALGRIPDARDETIPFLQDDRLVSGVRILFDFVAAPLALVTAIVLHLYAAKILFTAALPKNEIGWIVTFYSILVLSLRIAVDPFISGGAATTRIFARAFAPLLVVPLALLAYAALLRIGSEGVTLQRYYLALGGISTAIVLVLQGVPRWRRKIRLIAGVPLVLLLVSAVGPWGAPDTVGRSQMALIRAAARTEKDGAKLVPAAIPTPIQAALRSRLDALDEAGQLWRVVPLLEARQASDLRTALLQQPDRASDVVAAGLGLSNAASVRSVSSFTAGRDSTLQLSGYDVGLIERFVTNNGVRPSPAQPRPGSIALSLSGVMLTVALNGGEDRFALGAAVAALPDQLFSTDPKDLDQPVLDLVGEGGRHARLSIRQLSMASADKMVVSATLSVFLRSAEWPAAPANTQPASLGGSLGSGKPQPGGAVVKGPGR